MKKIIAIVFAGTVLFASNGDMFNYLNSCKKSNFDNLKTMLKNRHKLDMYDKNGDTLLTKIAKTLSNCYYNQDLAKIIIDNSDIIDLPDNAGDTPLIVSLRKDKDIYFSKFLISEGADINKPSKKDGKTPLMIAAKSANEEMVRVLDERFAKRGLKDNSGKSALDYAVQSGDEKILQKVYADKKNKFAFFDNANGALFMNLTKKGFHIKDKSLDDKKILFIYGNKKIYSKLCHLAKRDTRYLFMISYNEKINTYKRCKTNIKVLKFNKDFYMLLLKALRWRTPPMFLLRDKNGNIVKSGIDEKSLLKVGLGINR